MYTRISLEIILRFVEARLSSAVKRGRERMGGCLRLEYYVQSGAGIHKKRKRKRKKKWKKMEEIRWNKTYFASSHAARVCESSFLVFLQKRIRRCSFPFFLLLFLFTTNLLLYLTILFILLYFVRNLILYNLILNIYIEKNILRNFFRIKINKLILIWPFKLFTRFSIFIDLDFF